MPLISADMHLAVGGVVAKAGTALFLLLASTTLLCLLRRGSNRTLSLLQETAVQVRFNENRNIRKNRKNRKSGH